MLVKTALARLEEFAVTLNSSCCSHNHKDKSIKEEKIKYRNCNFWYNTMKSHLIVVVVGVGTISVAGSSVTRVGVGGSVSLSTIGVPAGVLQFQ